MLSERVNKAQVCENKTITPIIYNLLSGVSTTRATCAGPYHLPVSEQHGKVKLGARGCQQQRKTHRSSYSTHLNPTSPKVISWKPRPNHLTPPDSLSGTCFVPSYLTCPVSLAICIGPSTRFTDKEKVAQRLTCPRQGHTITNCRCRVSNSDTVGWKLEPWSPSQCALRIPPLPIQGTFNVHNSLS